MSSGLSISFILMFVIGINLTFAGLRRFMRHAGAKVKPSQELKPSLHAWLELMLLTTDALRSSATELLTTSTFKFLMLTLDIPWHPLTSLDVIMLVTKLTPTSGLSSTPDASSCNCGTGTSTNLSSVRVTTSTEWARDLGVSHENVVPGQPRLLRVATRCYGLLWVEKGFQPQWEQWAHSKRVSFKNVFVNCVFTFYINAFVSTFSRFHLPTGFAELLHTDMHLPFCTKNLGYQDHLKLCRCSILSQSTGNLSRKKFRKTNYSRHHNRIQEVRCTVLHVFPGKKWEKEGVVWIVVVVCASNYFQFRQV